jgi:peptidyl-prolyl cis-trans isomerase SurA
VIKTLAQDLIFKAYESLKNGESFSAVAKRVSDDAGSAMNGGDLGQLFCGSLPIQFEEVVFKQKKGSYSEPFKTEFGWHIVQPVEVEPYPSLENIRDEIDNLINKDERVEEPRNVLVEKLKKAYGSSVDKSALDDIILQYNNLRLKKDSSGVLKLLNSGRRLFTIGESAFAIKDFLVYLSAKPSLANAINRAFDSFMKDKVIAYEDARLEKKYPEFGHLMQEYRDGILLFEVSSNEVWDKASADEAGLKAYFAAHKADYAWNKPRFKGFLVECSTKEIAEKAQKRIKELPTDSVASVLDREFNTGSTVDLITEYGVFEEGANTTVDWLAFNKTAANPIETNLPEAFLEGKMVKNGPEELSDVMGVVISDYQNQLEQEWLKKLKKKYKVSIDKAVLKSVNNN